LIGEVSYQYDLILSPKASNKGEDEKWMKDSILLSPIKGKDILPYERDLSEVDK
jgi:hypothetical protein